MSKHTRDLLRSADDHVFALFRKAAPDAGLAYHGYSRTRELVDACKQLAKGLELDDEASAALMLSAWFYDACYAVGTDDHGKSLELCLQFLEQQQVRHPTPDQIATCFRGLEEGDRASAGLDGAPPPAREGDHEARDGVQLDPLSDLLHDGRLAALASEEYVERSKLLRLELERREGKPFSDTDWIQRCIAYFEAHPYRTPFAQLEYGSQRDANLVRLHKLLRRRVKEAGDARADGSTIAKEAGKTESMFYHYTRVHIGLLGLADRRTATMIHVNAIMISIVVALLVRRLDVDRYLLVPTLLLLAVNLAVVFSAIYSMRASRGRFSAEEERMREANILVFTNDTPVTYSKFAERMSELLRNPPQQQRTMIEHMYFVRSMLVARARALRVTYDIFIYGLALALLAYAVALTRR